MTNLARCPQCNAALPHGASWCSLCHADLRPAPVPAAAFATAGAHGSESVLTSDVMTSAESNSDLAPASLAAGAPPVRGRHRRTSGSSPSGSAGAVPPVLDVEAVVAQVPKDASGKPDVEILSRQMLAQLAASESPASGVPDFSRVPGGQWGVAFGGALALIVVLVGAAAVLGMVLNR